MLGRKAHGSLKGLLDRSGSRGSFKGLVVRSNREGSSSNLLIAQHSRILPFGGSSKHDDSSNPGSRPGSRQGTVAIRIPFGASGRQGSRQGTINFASARDNFASARGKFASARDTGSRPETAPATPGTGPWLLEQFKGKSLMVNVLVERANSSESLRANAHILVVQWQQTARRQDSPVLLQLALGLAAHCGIAVAATVETQSPAQPPPTRQTSGEAAGRGTHKAASAIGSLNRVLGAAVSAFWQRKTAGPELPAFADK
jgi:hypothetical protein